MYKKCSMLVKSIGLAFVNFIVQEVPDFTSQFISKDISESKPLKGLRVGVIRETLDEGVDAEVVSSILSAVSHLEELGCTVAEVFISLFIFISICKPNFFP